MLGNKELCGLIYSCRPENTRQQSNGFLTLPLIHELQLRGQHQLWLTIRDHIGVQSFSHSSQDVQIQSYLVSNGVFILNGIVSVLELAEETVNCLLEGKHPLVKPLWF